ncbi:helix-turn-helix transcriptional regulator [Erythrobacter litoralis]|uniref:Regulatory protein, LuxR n=1 Tax=Erythrobacter litoralis (strain HTCC2594) TaxID=314225 RepID=Q2NDZ6_ERYLH|nr:LuxR C-terminal-related transcriptional regulator [Erythrobacter litoralis]ABC62095.1 regulatory protein, LuxR [Erythrobacter litoralis HTCC2594]
MPISLEEAYDALADESLFSALIDSFGERLGARSYAGGWASNNSVEQIVAFKGFETDQVQQYLAGFAEIDPWTVAFLKRPVYGRFVDMLDYVDSDAYARSALYKRFFEPEGIDVFYAVAFMMLTDATQSGLTFHRGKKDGEFGPDAIAAVNEDAGDLARLFHLKVRMSQLLHKVTDWEKLLSRVNVELYLIDRSGRLVDCNETARLMLQQEQGLLVQAGRISATDPLTRAALERILGAAQKNRLEATDSFTVGSGGSARRLVVLPVESASGDLRLALIGESKKQLGAEVEPMLRAAYRLSPIEASIMIRLANGEGPKAISVSRSVSQETTKTQYRSAMRKMDCRTLTDAIIAVRRLPGAWS